MPLKDAAAVLGVSKDAVRQRVRRDTLRSDKGEDGRVYVYVDPTADAVSGPSVGDPRDALIAELQDRVRSLEDANRENRRIIAGLIQRGPELEAPREEPHGPETVSETAEGTDTPAAQVDRETGVQRRSWWRRFFGVE